MCPHTDDDVRTSLRRAHARSNIRQGRDVLRSATSLREEERGEKFSALTRPLFGRPKPKKKSFGEFQTQQLRAFPVPSEISRACSAWRPKKNQQRETGPTRSRRRTAVFGKAAAALLQSALSCCFYLPFAHSAVAYLESGAVRAFRLLLSVAQHPSRNKDDVVRATYGGRMAK